MSKFRKIIFLLCVFLTGAATLVLEIVGVRLIAPYFGSTIFVWSSLITATLGGLAAGYAIGSALSRKSFHEKFFYFSIFAFGILLIVLPYVVGLAASFSEQFGLRFGPLLSSMILFLPLFIFAGIAAPLSVKIYSEIHPAGVAAGRLYALGTVGSLLGALLTGFFLIPVLPLSQLLFITAWTLILPSLLGMFLGQFQKKIATGLLLLVAITSLLPLLPSTNPDTWATIVDRATDFYTGVKVIEFGDARCMLGGLKLYGCVDKNTGKTMADSLTTRSVLDPFVEGLPVGGSALLLGGGIGGALENLPMAASGTIVELDPNVALFSEKYFGVDKNRLTILVDDARHAVRNFKNENKQFNLVMMDVIQDTKIPAYIMSKEAFSELAAIIKPGGTLIIHGGVSLEQPPKDDLYVSSILQTGKKSFPFGEAVWRGDLGSKNLMFYFSDRPLPASQVAALPFSKAGPILTDDFNPLDYYNLDRQLILTAEMRSVFGSIALQ